MACFKCGGAVQAAPATPKLTINLNFAYPVYGDVPVTRLSAREDISVVLIGSTLSLAAGHLTALPEVIVNGLIGAGAPIWIF